MANSSGLSSLFGNGGIFVNVALIFSVMPAIIGVSYAMPTEGSYLWVNKNLVELLTLWVVVLFPTWKSIGLDRFLFNKK